jgi:tetratricopeptide (TPR) repeat protein
MSWEPTPIESGLVDIVRDLMTAHQMMRRVFARYRRGELAFKEVQDLVWDTEDAVLFRLKERSHALFRESRGESEVMMRREALFDLAVGSLFHEAMKFRENFYQRFVYGPKVLELRSQAGGENEELFGEFEKILEGSSVRLDEALQETEALLSQATSQLRVVVRDHSSSGLVARYLIRNAGDVEEVFAQDLDSLLAELYGSSTAGFRLAGCSLLASGYFDEARETLEAAGDRGGSDPELERLSAYAEGMSAFLKGRYADAVQGLERWVESEPGPDQSSYAGLAHAALSRIPQLASDDAPLAQVAGGLARRIQPLIVGPPAG